MSGAAQFSTRRASLSVRFLRYEIEKGLKAVYSQLLSCPGLGKLENSKMIVCDKYEKKKSPEEQTFIHFFVPKMGGSAIWE